MRFFVDENLSPTLAEICRHAGYDATSVRDRGMRSWMEVAIEEIEHRAADVHIEPHTLMVNAVLEVEESGTCQLFEHP